MFGVMWSEHCCYRNSRPLLRQLPHQRPEDPGGARRERRGGGSGRGPAPGLQDREPQPPLRRGALPGGRHRGGGHPAGHLHDGGPADRPAQRPALRSAGGGAQRGPDGGGGGRHRPLRQLRGGAHRGRRGGLRPQLRRQSAGQRHGPGPDGDRRDRLLRGGGGRQSGGLRGQHHRPRRHGRRQLRVRRAHRGLPRRPARRAGGGSLPGEGPDRGLPGGLPERRRGGRPGHGRRGPHLQLLGDGRQGRGGGRTRPRSGARPGGGDERLRVPALRIPGADAVRGGGRAGRRP